MRFQVLIFDLCLLLLLPAAIFAQDSRFSSTVTEASVRVCPPATS